MGGGGKFRGRESAGGEGSPKGVCSGKSKKSGKESLSKKGRKKPNGLKAEETRVWEKKGSDVRMH